MSGEDDSVFKSPCLPPSHHGVQSPSSPNRIGLVTSQIEGPIDTVDDVDAQIAEVEAEKEAKISIQAPLLHYTPPPWACEPDENDHFQLEVLKDGKIIGHFDMKNRKNSSYVVIGRIKPGCDLVMEHPSISRYHCILQFGDDRMTKTGKGWHIYDLGSTHGTKMNKRRLPVKQFIRTRVGFIFQFGESTRIYNLMGPEKDSEPEWDCSPTEMKLRKHRKELQAKLLAAAAEEMIAEEKREEEEEGCSWGMDYGEDAKPLNTIETDAHLMEDREAYYNQDPRKALAKFFEREGFDMNFEYNEQGQGHTHKWVCSIELPVEIDGVDRAFTASATVSTSKKDAQTQCALEACRILDSYNVLRRSNTKMRMKKKTLEENDYYDEDDDLYLDRTGQLEAQREKRKLWAEEGYSGKKVEKDTYESLCVKLEDAKKAKDDCQKELDKLAAATKKVEAKETDGDALDDYVRQLEKTGSAGDDAKTKTEKSKWRQRLVAAVHEIQKLEKLVKIAKPVEMKQAKNAPAGMQAFLKKMQAANKAKKDGNTNEQAAPVVEKPVPVEQSVMKAPALPPQKVTEQKKVEEPVAKTAEPEVPTEPVQVEKPVQKEQPIIRNEVEMEQEEVEQVAKESKLQKDVAEWEKELEVEKEKKRKSEMEARNRKRKMEAETVKNDKKVGKSEDYGVGCEDRNEKYSTWMPPSKEQSDAKQDALRAKFAGKY